MNDFRELLKNADRSYDGFVHADISCVKAPGNEGEQAVIEGFIKEHPQAKSSDVLHFMIEKTDFFTSIERQRAAVV